MRIHTWLSSVLVATLTAIGAMEVGAQQHAPYQYQTKLGPQATPVSSESTASLLQRIEALEASNSSYLIDRIEALEAELKANKEDDDSGCKEIDVLQKPAQKWSGRVHFDYWGFPESSALINGIDGGNPAAGPDDFIGFRRLRFGSSGRVNETMRYKIEMEFATPMDPTFKDAYLGWTDLPYLQTVLLGNQKRPYGLDHLNSSRYNVFLERPFVIEAFNQDARRIGLQSYGVSENESWNWRYGVFIMDDLAAPGFQRTDNYQSEVAGRLANTIWYDETSEGRGYAHWAVSGTAAMPGRGPDARFRTRPEARSANRWIDTGDLDAHTYQLLGLEGVVNLGALQIVGEYQTARVQRATAADVEFGGGYVYAAYFLTGEHTPWERDSGTIGRVKPFENFFRVRGCDGCTHSGWGAWQIAARYSYGDFTDEDVFGGVGESFTAGVNWWWNPYARMQFNYIYGDLSDRMAAGNDGWYNIFGARFMCDF